jgi:hypothetical protein
MSISTPRNTPKEGAFFNLTPEQKKQFEDGLNSALRATPQNVVATNLHEKTDADYNDEVREQKKPIKSSFKNSINSTKERKKVRFVKGGKKKKRTQRHKKKRGKKTRSYKRHRY